ncbi:LppU/SCO3897 family protein [Amycolatopsis lurida]
MSSRKPGECAVRDHILQCVDIGDCVFNAGTEQDPKMEVASCSSERTQFTLLKIEAYSEGKIFGPGEAPCRDAAEMTHYYRVTSYRYGSIGGGTDVWCLRFSG